MFPYIPNTSEEINKMLNVIGVSNMDDLFSDIPEEIRLNRELDINKPMSELEVIRRMTELSGKNLSTDDLVCFLGAGAYDHYVPSIIKHITSRSEFSTSYTPYQPEISQGTLQVIFEYQTMISNLTGMDFANASVYDAPTAAAEAAMMAIEATKRKTVLISKTVHPEVREVLATYMKHHGGNLVEIGYKDGETDIEELKTLLTKDVAGLIVQNPNFFGVIEDLTEVEKLVHQNKSLLMMGVDPISLGILKSPGEIGADIAFGEGQSLGNALNYGGPYLGFMAAASKLLRKMPGRIVGQTEDLDGKRAFVLTLQAREQHIRREKATSNICSNQALNALSAAIYLTTLGKSGIREVALQCAKKAKYAHNEICKSSKYKPAFDKPFFKEFAIKSEVDVEVVNEELLNCGIIGGYKLGGKYENEQSSLLFCVTEKRTKAEIDTLAGIMEGLI